MSDEVELDFLPNVKEKAVKEKATKEKATPEGAAQTEDWEPPIPLGDGGTLPDFPVEVLPAYIELMVAGVAEEMQVPTDLPASLALAVLGTAAGGRAEVEVRGQWREPLNIYVGTAMEPGAGKSPAFRAMVGPVYAAEKTLREEARSAIQEKEELRRAAMIGAEEAKKKAKEPEEIKVAIRAITSAEAMDVPVVPRLTADDVTPAQAATILVEQGGRLAILSAEPNFLEIVLGKFNSGKPDLGLFLKGHAGDRLQVDRRGREEFVDRPALTVGITLQPQMLQELAAKREMQGRGALARLLFCLPPDLVGNRKITTDVVPPEIVREYFEKIEHLIKDLAGWTDPAIITLSPGALRDHTKWRGDIEPRLRRGTGDLESLREWASKLAGHTIRLAGLLHIAENTNSWSRSSISEETMGRAIKLAQYFTAHAMAAFGVMRGHPLAADARAVMEWVGDKTQFRPREVQRALHRRFTAKEELTRVLSLLEERGYIRLAPSPATGGRRPTVYDVNPIGR